MISRRSFWLVLWVVLTPVPLFAKKPRGLDQAQTALAAVQHESAAHKAAAAKAGAQVQANAAKAAALAQQQVVAAAAVRQLEDQTAQAASHYAELQGQSQAAAQALRVNAADLAKLLPVMQHLAAEPAASLLAVPQSPADAVRGVIVMQGIAAEIARRAVAITQQTALVATLTAATRTQQTALVAAVATQGLAEATLTKQIASARAAELEASQTALKEAAAAATADRRLRDLHDMVAKLQAAPMPRLPLPLAAAPPGHAGHADAPVAGTIVEDFGANTAAGPAQGISYRAAPGARVVSPCAGPVKFADRFQSYGLVVITDCGGGDYVVLSGLAHLDVAAGQILARRQPVGEMLGFDSADPARQPVLYFELRHNGTPINPAGWLAGS